MARLRFRLTLAEKPTSASAKIGDLAGRGSITRVRLAIESQHDPRPNYHWIRVRVTETTARLTGPTPDGSTRGC